MVTKAKVFKDVILVVEMIDAKVSVNMEQDISQIFCHLNGTGWVFRTRYLPADLRLLSISDSTGCWLVNFLDHAPIGFQRGLEVD